MYDNINDFTFLEQLHRSSIEEKQLQTKKESKIQGVQKTQKTQKTKVQDGSKESKKSNKSKESKESKKSKESKESNTLIDKCSRMFAPDCNFHAAVTNTILQHIRAMENDSSYPTKILLVTGKTGVGKTYCVKNACFTGGYDLLDFDDCEVEKINPKTKTVVLDYDRQVFTLLNVKKANKFSVAFIDGIDSLDRHRLNAIRKHLEHQPPKKKKGATAEQKKTSHNFVIMTATDRYQSSVRDLLFKVKPVEIKVNELEYNQKVVLAEKCRGGSLPTGAYPMIASSSSCISSMLTRLELLLLGAGTTVYDMDKCHGELNIFQTCKQLLRPNDEQTFDEYEELWELGGPNVPKILFHSYPEFVHTVPETPKEVVRYMNTKQDRTKAVESMVVYKQGRFFTQGVNMLASVSDMYSWQDSMDYSIVEILSEYMKRLVRHECTQVLSCNAKNPLIDVKTNVLQSFQRPAYLAKCRISRYDDDMYRMIAKMKQGQIQRQIQDYEFKPNLTYDLERHIGIHYVRNEAGQLIPVDMFELEKTNERIKKQPRKFNSLESAKKRVKPVVDTVTPVRDAIKLFSHIFHVEEEQQQQQQKKRKFTITLSDGTKIEKKPKIKN